MFERPYYLRFHGRESFVVSILSHALWRIGVSSLGSACLIPKEIKLIQSVHREQ